MGYVFATIGLVNRWRVINDRHELADDYEIRSIEVEMLVDTGSLYMCINESIRTYLNLEVIDKGKFQLADGMVGEYEIVGPVEVRFANRTCRVDAIVLPGNNQCLLGAIPMEAMDILISPTRQELVVNPAHPDYALFRL